MYDFFKRQEKLREAKDAADKEIAICRKLEEEKLEREIIKVYI